MSFIEILRSSRSKPVAAIHKFLTNYDPNDSNRTYVFVEGEADQAFYRAHIHGHVSNDVDIYIYNCQGKSNVYDAYRAVIERYPTCRRVLFFVDKDIDDIIGVQWPSDPRVFTTDCYSIENYLVSAGTMMRYLSDYVKIRRIELSLEKIEEEFNRQLADFYRLILPVMAWIIEVRRAGLNAILNDFNCAEIFYLCDEGFRKKRGKRSAYLSRATRTNPPNNLWREIRRTCRELKKANPERYTRGKFALWWFSQFAKWVLEGLGKVTKEEGGSISVSVALNEKNCVQLLASVISTPSNLESFLSFHLGASASTSESGAHRPRTATTVLRKLLGG